MGTMDRDLDWARLGAALKTDREQRGLTQKEVAQALDASVSSIQVIEYGHIFSRPTRTIRKYAELLHWTHRSVDEILAGGDPDYVPEAPASAPAAPAPEVADLDGQRLPLRIVHELSDDGELLDTEVIRIGGKGRAVIIVKGDPGVAPDELAEELRAWLAARDRLQQGASSEPPAATGGA